MNHTSGPWRHLQVQHGSVSVITDHLTICQVIKGIKGDDNVMANARLIAAAPDLLAACRKAKSALELEYGKGCAHYIDEAIEKAEGAR